MRLFFDHAGPLMHYEPGILHIKDLNPERHLQWRMSKGELLRLGWRCIWAAVRS